MLQEFKTVKNDYKFIKFSSNRESTFFQLVANGKRRLRTLVNALTRVGVVSESTFHDIGLLPDCGFIHELSSSARTLKAV